LDLLEPIDSDLAGRLFDGGVNCGVGAAGRWLQRCLNVLNGARAWPDLSTDGVCGASTRYALQAFLAARGPDGRRVLLAMVCALQAAGYITIAEGNPTQRRFEWGWQSTRAFPRTQPEEGRKSC
jgi:lysozyme family protein